MEKYTVKDLLDKHRVENVNQLHGVNRTFGEKVSDALAQRAGSWTFILSFLGFLLVWILINGFLLSKAVDPYPFILLNLMLSCIAALQAPIIMMSQRRQEEKDRLRIEQDFAVDQKTELLLEEVYRLLQEIEQEQRLHHK